MKHVLLLITLASISALSLAQPAIQWQNSYGGSLGEGFNVGGQQQNQISNTADGGVIIAGFSYSNDGDVTGHHGLVTTSDGWVVKLDSLGNLEWQRSLGGTNAEVGQSVIQTSDGGYLASFSTLSDDGDVTGFHSGGTGIINDAWIVKLDSVGNIIWEKAFGGTGNDIIHSIIETHDGHYIGAGRTSTNNDGDISGNNGAQDILILKFDTAGTLLMQKCIGGTAGDYAYTIRQTSDNGFVIAGDVNSTNGDFTGAVLNFFGSTFVMKLDTVANVEWFRIYGGNSLDFGYDVFQTPDGGYFHGIASASSDLTGAHGGLEYVIYRLDAAGNQIWQQCYGGTLGDWFKTFKPTPDGGLVLIGESISNDGDVSNNHGGPNVVTDAWVVKLDSLGVIQWSQCYGGTGPEDGTSIIVMPDGGIVIGVESGSNDGDVSGHHGPLSENDIWIAKLAPLNTGVDDHVSALSGLTIAPVPVMTSARISFTLNQPGMLEVIAYDVHGRIADIPYASYTQAGPVQFDWNIADKNHIGSGVYLLSFKSGETQTTLKVLIQK